MQKLAPSYTRIATIAVFALSCFGLLLFLWLSFGGTVPLQAKGYRFNIIFPQAQLLAVDADVRISGVDVGTVVALKEQRRGVTVATIQMQSRYAPVPSDMRAQLRAKTLLGETYVALAPGTRRAPPVPDGGTLGIAQVEPSVQLDEIYRTFNPETRAAFQTWLQQSALGLAGRGADLNAALGELDPFSNDLAQVAATLQSQNGAVQALVRNTGIVFDALTQRTDQLRDLVTASKATFGATAAASEQLAAAFQALPTFEVRSAQAERELDQFSSDASPLLTQFVPIEKALTPALHGVERLSPPLDRLLTGLGPLAHASTSGLPALDDALNELRPLLKSLSPVLRNLNPVLQFADLYQPELESAFANDAAGTQFTTGSGVASLTVHAARAFAGPLNVGSLAIQQQRYGSDRSNPYALPGAFNALATGLATYDTGSCSNPTPTATGPASGDVSQYALGLFDRFDVTNASGKATAPPCKGQAPLTFNGLSTTFPHVLEAPS